MGVSLVLSACGDDKVSDTYSKSKDEEITLSTEDVKNVYSQNCASCHGQILADGIPGDLDKVGAELSKEKIEKIIRKGKGMMEGGLVEGEEASALVEWLSTMK